MDKNYSKRPLVVETTVQGAISDTSSVMTNDSLFGDRPGEMLASHVQKTWETNRRHKEKLTYRLLECLRARKGEYSEYQLGMMRATGGSNPVYLKLTGTKCRAASAWIRDVLMPSGDTPFMIRPTELPELPRQLSDAAREQARQEAIGLLQMGVLENMDETLAFIEKTRDLIKEQLDKDAHERAKRMQEKITDLMQEGGWESAFEEFIEDFVTYPTAFLKGPFIKKVRTLDWDTANGFEPQVVDELVLGWERKSPFDIYPAPYQSNLQKGDFIEHIRFTKEALFNCIGIPGYNEENIRSCLDEYDNGGLEEWVWQDYEKAKLENDSWYIFSDKSMIDGLHFWGTASGKMLKDWGVEGASKLDDEKHYQIEAIKVGQHIIRAELNDSPTGMRPYHHACWDAVPGSIWGIALAEQMEDNQKIVNACARALMDNMALASGPQCMVITDMLAEGESIQTMYPFKIWQAKLAANAPNSIKPIDFFQPNLNADQLLKVLETIERKADDVTNVPRYSYGNDKGMGAGDTSSGLAMLMNAAAKGIRRAVSNIDSNCLRPTVYQTYVHVMLYDPDTTLKTDCKVAPKGAVSLLIKEQNLVRLQTFLNQTTNPIDAQIIGMRGRAKILREIAKLMSLDVDEIIPSDDELQAMEMQQQMMAQQQAQMGGPESPEEGPAEGAAPPFSRGIPDTSITPGLEPPQGGEMMTRLNRRVQGQLNRVGAPKDVR